MKLLPVLLLATMVISLTVSCHIDKSGTDEVFSKPTDVQGVSCSYVVYYDDRKMKSCVLAREDTLSGQPLPEGTIVFFSLDGVMESCFLQQDTEIQGHLCRGRSDNWQTTFYPNGRRKLRGWPKMRLFKVLPAWLQVAGTHDRPEYSSTRMEASQDAKSPEIQLLEVNRSRGAIE